MTDDRRQKTAGRRCGLAICMLIALFCTTVSHAAIVLNDPELWGSGLAGWTNDAPGIGDGDATISNPGSSLRLTFGDQGGGPAMPETDTMYSSATNFTGDYQPFAQLGVQFTFIAQDIAPDDAAVYLHSSVTTSLWSYAFSPGAGSNTFAVPLTYGTGWSGPGGAAEFWADLANIDWIGINIVRNADLGEQRFDIDNWEYILIPEPGTWCMLAAAFMSLGVTFRNRLRMPWRA